METPLITNDAVILGILFIILAFVFYTSSTDQHGWKRFYSFVPAILLCYFLPSLLNTFHVIDGEKSQLYPVMSRYFLPVSLVLLTLGIDFKALKKLGPKALILFLTGSLGVMIGGPLAILICKNFTPELFETTGPGAVWRGMSTIAGSWIGGSANQAAMKELFGVSDGIFSAMITIDVIVSYIWMVFLLYGAGKSTLLDKKLRADTSAIVLLKQKLEAFQLSTRKITSLTDLMMICGIGFGATAIAHFLADIIAPYISVHAPQLEKFSLTSSFFWLILITTTIGMVLAATKARKLEGAGASQIGTLLLYLLIATLGMKMDISGLFKSPALLLVCIVWILIHIVIMLVVAKIIKAPFFFVAVGSMANIGGPASAPVIASAFSPALAPVGVLLAVLGYAIGTYAAYMCGIMMQWASGH
ncbi:MAG: DUF819 family protein [Bacteroidota bacterium]